MSVVLHNAYLEARLQYLESIGYKFLPAQPKEECHGYGIYNYTVNSPDGEALGSIGMFTGNTEAHRLLDQFGCP